MQTNRMAGIPGFGIDQVAAIVGDDPDVLRLENLDTDTRPPPEALEATSQAVFEQTANSWLPFTGKLALKRAIADQFRDRTGLEIEPESQVTITCGEGDAMLDAIFVTTDPGDEVVLTDPTYAGMINRVRIAGAVPRFARLFPNAGVWRLDLESLKEAVNQNTKAIFIAPPALPTGWVPNDEEWEAVANLCREGGLWLLHFGWKEKILFDGLPFRHPAAMPEMAERVIHIGSVSMKQRMIGWRVGWLVSPNEVAGDASRAHIYNGLTPGGIAQAGALAALHATEDGLEAATAEWQLRRDVMLEQLAGLPAVKPAGGWSLVMESQALGIDPPDLSLALARHGVAATPMSAWGEAVAPRYIRFIYSREPAARIALLRDRPDAALEELAETY